MEEQQDMLNASNRRVVSYNDIFNKLDKNGDMLVDSKDLLDFINSEDGKIIHLPKNIERRIKQATAGNSHKKFTYAEFLELFSQPTKQKDNRGFIFWINRYVNTVVPKPKPTTPPPSKLGRRLKRAAVPDEELDYLEEYSCCPPPISLLIMSLIEITFFLIDECIESGSTWSGDGVVASVLLYDPEKREQAWRFVTYMFVHVGHLHLINNVLFQILIGLPLEMVHKWWRVLLIYFSGVIAGSLASSVIDPTVKLAGASGGVYALLTAHISSIILNWHEMTFPAIQIFIISVFTFSDLGTAVYDRYYLNEASQVSFIAHIGGATAGLLVGIYVLKNLRITRTEKYLWWCALVVYVVLTVTAVLLNVLLPREYFARSGT